MHDRMAHVGCHACDRAQDAGVQNVLQASISPVSSAQGGHEPGTRLFGDYLPSTRGDDPQSFLSLIFGHKKPRGDGGAAFITY